MLCYLGIIKEGFSTYSSPVMLISRKVSWDIRIVTNFRYLNGRITKKVLAYHLIKDIFSILGHSRSKVLLISDLKDAVHLLRLSENSKQFCGFIPYFGST